MILFRVTGKCEVCNSFFKLEGVSNPDDALMLFFQEHRSEKGHFFVGMVQTSQYDEDPKLAKRPDWRKKCRNISG